MQISVKTTNDVKVMTFEGNLDSQTSSDAQTRLIELIEGGERKILVDLEKLAYISSAGLHVLLRSFKKLKAADGELRICGLNEVVGKVFDAAGFTLIFKIFGTESEALEEF